MLLTTSEGWLFGSKGAETEGTKLVCLSSLRRKLHKAGMVGWFCFVAYAPQVSKEPDQRAFPGDVVRFVLLCVSQEN